MSIKMKGLLKGLRYISHIFEEEEKEAEIQIGYPTDVKHVAHIGWDGPSASSPSWMNDFKSSPASGNGDVNKDPEEVIKSVSQDSAKAKVKDSPGRDLPSNLPKSSRRQPSADSLGSVDSPAGSPTKSSKASRRRSKHKESTSPKGDESSSSQGIPNIPKKSRRKKSKDEGSTHSSRSKEKGSRRGSRLGSDDGSVKQFGSDSGLTTLREEDHG